MRAIRYYGPKDVRLDEVPEPIIGPSQIKIKIAWCGICGTDLHTFHGEVPAYVPTATKPHPITGETLPVILGHEFSGTIVELGTQIDRSRFSIGQNVTVEPTVYCGKPDCPGCSDPTTRPQCPNLWVLGLCGGGGGLSEYIAVDHKLVHVLPPNVPLELGALVEPLAVAWRAAKKANVKPGNKVLIQGAGPVAIFMIHTVKLFGASWVAVSGRRAKRCEIASQHGASVVYDLAAPSSVDVAAEVMKATGRGADVVIDCAGTQLSMDTSLQAVRPGGMIMNVASWSVTPTIDMNLMIGKEAILANSIAYSNDHPDILQAMAQGKLGDLTSLITARVPLEDFIEKGVKPLATEKDKHVKILIHP
ncbi:L-threonine 3-dehydrogenase [Cubamyces sp. BRFM 1775]|nr:L-threonine 3-dehydrogenase [Cubamyces sp. BRFM 1775]